RAFPLGRLWQRDRAHLARIQLLADRVDHASLAGGIASLEQHHHAGAGLPEPAREIVQFELQRLEAFLVLLLLHLFHDRLRVLPGASAHKDRDGTATASGRRSLLLLQRDPAYVPGPPDAPGIVPDELDGIALRSAREHHRSIGSVESDRAAVERQLPVL